MLLMTLRSRILTQDSRKSTKNFKKITTLSRRCFFLSTLTSFVKKHPLPSGSSKCKNVHILRAGEAHVIYYSLHTASVATGDKRALQTLTIFKNSDKNTFILFFLKLEREYGLISISTSSKVWHGRGCGGNLRFF